MAEPGSPVNFSGAVDELGGMEMEKIEEHASKCWRVKIGKGTFMLDFNPVVTGVAAVSIWVFVILCCALPEQLNDTMGKIAFGWVVDIWTWIYMASQNIWICVLLYLMCSKKYGNLRLGPDDSKPEIADATWFALLFSAGVAVGLWWYGVAEPMWHYKGWGGARFVSGSKGYGNLNEDAIHAVMVTYFHWGVHGWIPYVVIGALTGLNTYRRGLPMSIRYCFEPLLGHLVYGICGDLIDILSIMTTMSGVCTSLGLAGMQLNAGFQRVGHGFYRGTRHAIPDGPQYQDPLCDGSGRFCSKCGETDTTKDGAGGPLAAIAGGIGGQCFPSGTQTESVGVQIGAPAQISILLIITVLATISVVSGLQRGIAMLSRFTFWLGNLILVAVLVMGNPWHILNVIVQATGFYIWYIIKIAFQCDAYELIGGPNDGNGGDTPGGAGWMGSWTIFYWGWWISWGPFMGVFLARISKGRTLRQFIIGTLLLPTAYSIVWFGVLGAEGILMQRKADSMGVCTHAYGAAGNCIGDTEAPCRTVTAAEPDFPDASEANPIFTCGNKKAGTCHSYSAQYSDAFKRDWPEKIITQEGTVKPYTKAQWLAHAGRGDTMGFTAPCDLQDESSRFFQSSLRCNRMSWKRKLPVGNKCITSVTEMSKPCLPEYADQLPTWIAAWDETVEWETYWRAKRTERFTALMSDPTYMDTDITAMSPSACKPPVNSDTMKEPSIGAGDNRVSDADLTGADKLYNHFDAAGLAANPLPDCFIPAPDSIVCLYNQGTTDVLFDQMESYGGQGLATFLIICCMACLIVYFVSSSDSGSFVIDIMAANGLPDPPIAQRVFWALTEGATASALLYSGASLPDPQASLKALQATSIIMGLPYTFMLFWNCQALLQVAAEEAGVTPKGGPMFNKRLFVQNPVMVLKNTFVPFIDMGALAEANGNWPIGNKVWTYIFALQWLMIFVIIILTAADYSFLGIAFSLYVLYTMFITILRRDTRLTYHIQSGGAASDFMCAFFLPMFTISQLIDHIKTGPPPKSVSPQEGFKEETKEVSI
jgi:choline-glycine betaine transporter